MGHSSLFKIKLLSFDSRCAISTVTDSNYSSIVVVSHDDFTGRLGSGRICGFLFFLKPQVWEICDWEMQFPALTSVKKNLASNLIGPQPDRYPTRTDFRQSHGFDVNPITPGSLTGHLSAKPDHQHLASSSVNLEQELQKPLLPLRGTKLALSCHTQGLLQCFPKIAWTRNSTFRLQTLLNLLFLESMTTLVNSIKRCSCGKQSFSWEWPLKEDFRRQCNWLCWWQRLGLSEKHLKPQGNTAYQRTK